MRVYATVNPRTHARIVHLAHVEDVPVSRLVATLLREGLEARARERERISREFSFPPGMWIDVPAVTRR